MKGNIANLFRNRVVYDANNRPIRFTKAGGSVIVENGYDFMGRRYMKKVTENGTVTRHERYLYRGYLQIAALDILHGGKQKHALFWDPTEPLATRPLVLLASDDNRYTYAHDLTKNVTELIDEQGNIAATYDYDPFGKVTKAGVGAVLNSIQWSSEVYDAELGLVYYNYRHYNPADGRWINRDPIAERGGMNLYGFVGNAMLYEWDILGMDSYDKPKDPCYYRGKVAVLLFNGKSLSGPGINVDAVSGKPKEKIYHTKKHGRGWFNDDIYTTIYRIFDYRIDYQKVKDIGPTPEGEWWFSACDTNSANNSLRHRKYNLISYDAWGQYSWHIRPNVGTDVTSNTGEKRENLFLHGGIRPDSRGCIDAFGGGDVKIKRWIDEMLKEQKCCYVTIIVKYESEVVMAKKEHIVKSDIIFWLPGVSTPWELY